MDFQCKLADPKLFRLNSPDHCASEEEISEVERMLSVTLPCSYREFLKEFGGGDFGSEVVFSADPNSEWYLPAKCLEAEAYLPEGFLAFSDDFAGGHYVLKVEGGRAQEPIFYWNQDGGLSVTKYTNILEYLANNAY